MVRTFLSACVISIIPYLTSAHEFWIEPVEWRVAQGAVIEANIRVGQNMKGAAQPYIPDGTRRFDVATPTGIFRAGGTIGDRPVLKGKANDQGLYVVVYVTGNASLDYNEAGKFESFVSEKGLDFAIDEHKARGLPAVGFREIFSRYAKSLISVGNGQGGDKHFGLLTEITALSNPYTDDVSNGLPIYVSYRGEPRPKTQVEVFERNPEGEVAVTNIHTDEQGRASVPVKPGYDYMLNSVVIRAIKSENLDGAVWETLWANLTFAIPAIK